MIRRISIAVMAFGVIVGFGVLGASSASALLFLTQLNPELFTILNLNSSAKKLTIETKGGNAFTCESILGHGLILNKTDIAEKILFTYHGCGSAGQSCNSPGEPSGLIKTLDLDALLVTLLGGLYGIVLLAEKGNQNGNLAYITCAGGLQKLEVKGTIAGELTASKASLEAGAEETKLSFIKGTNKGEPAIFHYWTLQGLVVPKLEFTLSGLINETSEASLEALFDIMGLHVIRFCHN